MTDKHQSDMYLENRILKIKDNSLKKYQDIRGDMIERSYPKQNKLNASDNTLVIVRIESIPWERMENGREVAFPAAQAGYSGVLRTPSSICSANVFQFRNESLGKQAFHRLLPKLKTAFNS